MNKIRTATVTWITWLNYGSYLQAYALQHVIHKLGFENAIIDDERIVYSSGKPSDKDWIKKLPLYKQLYVYISQLFSFSKRVREDKIIRKRYNRFRELYLTTEDCYESLSELNEKYDVFIAGSDQIWLPLHNFFKPYYYLDFVLKKKISYAASGIFDFYPKEYKEQIFYLLNNFSHISVREMAGKKLLESFLQKNVEVSLDPTLLLTAQDWDGVANKRRIKHPYILCYLLTWNEHYLQYARDYADQRNLPLYIFSNNEKYRPFADRMIAAGPSEFISSFRDASFILTDSYHGTIFSIIHEKEFITYKRFRDTDGHNQNERLNNLFNITGITNRFLAENELSLNVFGDPINYVMVSNKLKDKRMESIAYLKNAILN